MRNVVYRIKGKILKLLKLSPIYKAYPWGGVKLKERFGKSNAPEICAESWELACHPDGECLVSGGEYDGRTLSSVLMGNQWMLGSNCGDSVVSPIMIKLIDAREDLSVQVHPDDEYAFINEGKLGKTEMWYVIERDEGAHLYYGLNRKVNREDFATSLKDGSVLGLLNKVPVNPGDVFFIDPGTVHAIGKGIVLAEIQQNSNVTYRLYDYGRLENGAPRTLHIEKGTACATLQPARPHCPPEGFIGSCEYFSVMTRIVSDNYSGFASGDSFHILLIIEGGGEVRCESERCFLAKGDSIFIPAGAGDYSIKGNLEMLVSFVGIAE